MTKLMVFQLHVVGAAVRSFLIFSLDIRLSIQMSSNGWRRWIDSLKRLVHSVQGTNFDLFLEWNEPIILGNQLSK